MQNTHKSQKNYKVNKKPNLHISKNMSAKTVSQIDLQNRAAISGKICEIYIVRRNLPNVNNSITEEICSGT